MKSLAQIISTILIVITTSSVFANIENLLHELDVHLSKSEWRKFDEKTDLIQAQFSANSELVTLENHFRFQTAMIDALLARRKFDEVYSEITHTSALVFPKFKKAMESAEINVPAEHVLVDCLMAGHQFIASNMDDHYAIVLTLMCQLAEYYLYQDKLQDAEALLATLIRKTASYAERERRTEIRIFYISLNVKACRLMGSVYFYMDNLSAAADALSKAKHRSRIFAHNSNEKGYINLGLAKLAFVKKNRIENLKRLNKADQYFKRNCVTGQAYLDLATLEAKLSEMTDIEETMDALVKIEKKFADVEDSFGRGLTLILRSKLNQSQQPVDDESESDIFLELTRELGKAHEIPLLLRLAKGQAYSPYIMRQIVQENTNCRRSSETESDSPTDALSSHSNSTTPRSESEFSFNSHDDQGTPRSGNASCSSSAPTSPRTSVTTPRAVAGLQTSSSFRTSPLRVPGTRVDALSQSGNY